MQFHLMIYLALQQLGHVYQNIFYHSLQFTTKTTRMPAFWGYPSLPHDYAYYWAFHIGSQVKTKQSQSYKFKELAKTSNFYFWKKIYTQHPTPLKSLDKMSQYKMDLASILEDIEQTRFCPQMDRQTYKQRDDRWTDGQGEASIPLHLRWAKGMINITIPMKLVQYYGYSVSTLGTDGLVF